MVSSKPKKAKRNPFTDPSRYGTYEGEFGNPSQWAGAFKKRMHPDDVKRILGDNNPWEILGLRVGATQSEIKSAYRKRVRETHPDVTGKDGEEFKQVQAAYEKIFSE